MKEPLLSVIIISYKQVKYIREAIESVLSQNVTFEYELLLADDCSNDGTEEILKEYERKFSFVKILKRKQNLGASKNYMEAVSHAKGKYITILEGDDYWCNNNKIEKQVSFLEKNNDYSAVGHLQEGRNLKGEFQGLFPKKLDNDMIVNDVNDLILKKKISSSTLMFRNYNGDAKKIKDLEYLYSLDPIIGDSQRCSYLASLGKIYIFKEPMMVYRMRNNDGDSNFNSTCKINEIELRYLKINKLLDKFFDYKYNYYYKIKTSFTLGVAYDICTLNFKDIKNFKKELPKKYKFKIYLLFPLTCIEILYNRFSGKK